MQLQSTSAQKLFLPAAGHVGHVTIEWSPTQKGQSTTPPLHRPSMVIPQTHQPEFWSPHKDGRVSFVESHLEKGFKKPAKNGLLDSTGFYWIPMGLSQHLPSHPLRVSDGAGKRLVLSQSQGLTRLTPKPSLASVLPWPGQMPSPSGWAMILRHDRLMHSSFCASVLGQEFFDVDNTLGRLSSAELISPNLLPLWFRLAFDHLSLHLAALPQSTNGRNSPKLNVAEAYCSRES